MRPSRRMQLKFIEPVPLHTQAGALVYPSEQAGHKILGSAGMGVDKLSVRNRVAFLLDP